MIRSLLLGAAALATCASAAPVLIPANSSSVAWVGRRIYTDQGVSFDWEGVQASITIANATFVGCQILDAATGGARFAVVYNNSMMWPAAQRTGTGSSSSGVSDPDPGHNEVPGLRVATLVTSPYQSLYTLGAGESISGMTGTWSLTLLTEPQFVGDISPNQTLTLVGFVTDGVVLEPPAGSPGRRSRRLTFLGDSLTAGYGSGFDIPTGAVCGGGVLQDDVTYSYGAVLCSSAVFNADCDWAAVSGITLTRPTDLPDLWPYAMGSALQHWPKGTWPLWNFSSFVPDAVVINLDDGCVEPEPFIAAFATAYVNFVQTIAAAFNNKALPFFLTIAPHEKGQSVGILRALGALQQQGYAVTFLNATVDATNLPAGCGGHPGPTIHAAAAARAAPVIASVLGW